MFIFHLVYYTNECDTCYIIPVALNPDEQAPPSRDTDLMS